MVAAISSVTLQVGLDPSDFSLIAYGGCGPVHACHLAQVMGMNRVIVPANAGVFSSVGTLASRLEFHLVTTVLVALGELSQSSFDEILSKAADEASRNFAGSHSAGIKTTIRHTLEMRYRGQTGVLEIPVNVDGDGKVDFDSLRQAFAGSHRVRYGFVSEGEVIELINVRTVVGSESTQAPPWVVGRSLGKTGAQRQRSAYFGPEWGWLDTPVVGRDSLGEDGMPGPLMVDDYDTTTVVPPKGLARIDRWSNVVVELT
jgi:N-methylhydantoinase A